MEFVHMCPQPASNVLMDMTIVLNHHLINWYVVRKKVKAPIFAKL